MSIEDAFHQFHANNPDVFAMFSLFSEEAIRAGRTVLSASLIFERMRWETTVVTDDPDYKLNNNFRAYYAREFMKRYPGSGATFRTRTVH